MAEAEKEIKQFQKRLLELANKSYQQNIYTFTGFLGLSEQDAAYQAERQLSYAGMTFFGGREGAERVVLRFGNPEAFGYEEEFPIALLKIEPVQQKFADELTHRDFLGAMMNLGIERSTLGDIYIKENCGYAYCLDSIADFIAGELYKIKHTSVTCSRARTEEILEKQETVSREVQISSERIDGIIAKVYQMSRNKSVELFQSGKVYINGRLCENNSCYLKKDDVVTVRGFGRFVFAGIAGETRKGKLKCTIIQ